MFCSPMMCCEEKKNYQRYRFFGFNAHVISVRAFKTAVHGVFFGILSRNVPNKQHF